MWRSFAVVLAVALAASSVSGDKNPGFPPYFAITPENTPGVQGVPTGIDVRTWNTGTEATNGVEVSLFFNDWGAIYSGWQLIGSQTVDLPAGPGGNELKTFTHTFQAAAHTCLKAEITDAPDGNDDTTDDTIQINWDVISADDAADIELYIPFGNADGEEIIISGTEVVCVNGTEIIQCPFTADGDRIPRPAVVEDGGACVPGGCGDTALDGNSEILAKATVAKDYMTGLALDELTFMVRTEMGPKDGPKEKIHAMITILKTTVAEVLNKPHLCCIESIKTRVLLESILADALDAYEADPSDCRLALKLLRMFVQKAKLLECDLTDEEIKCIQKAVQAIVDAGLMIVRENGNAKASAYLKEAMFFRRSGLYEATLLEAAKGCPPL